MAKPPPASEVIHTGKAVAAGDKLPATAAAPRRRRRATLPPAVTAAIAQTPAAKALNPTPLTPVDLSTPAGRSHALAETVVMGILDRLRQEALICGGKLGLDDLDRLAADFHGKTAALRMAFEQTFEAYANARERAKFTQNRNFPFDRVLVKRFEHLLARGNTGDPDKISRRVLPGFFMAAQMMLGAEILEGYQQRCRTIVERIKASHGGKFAWPDLYADPETDALAFEALAHMASYFAGFDKRARWFLAIVNGHLAAAPAGASYAEANWQLSEKGFRAFLAALFAEVRPAVATPEARTHFTERFGVKECLAVTDAMQALYGR